MREKYAIEIYAVHDTRDTMILIGYLKKAVDGIVFFVSYKDAEYWLVENAKDYHYYKIVKFHVK